MQDALEWHLAKEAAKTKSHIEVEFEFKQRRQDQLPISTEHFQVHAYQEVCRNFQAVESHQSHLVELIQHNKEIENRLRESSSHTNYLRQHDYYKETEQKQQYLDEWHLYQYELQDTKDQLKNCHVQHSEKQNEIEQLTALGAACDGLFSFIA